MAETGRDRGKRLRLAVRPGGGKGRHAPSRGIA